MSIVIKENILTEDSPRTSQPAAMTVILYPHQLSAVAAMLEFEEKKHVIVDISTAHIYDNSFINNYVFNDIFKAHRLEISSAILNDNVGYGKTITILALISTNRIPTNTNIILTQCNMECRFTVPVDRICPSNIIIVPEHLTIQWIGELSKTHLTWISITSDMELVQACGSCQVELIDTADYHGTYVIIDDQLYYLDKIILTNLFKSTQAILTTESMFKKILLAMKQCDYCIFARVIMDDIPIVNELYYAGIFTWIVSATKVKFNFNNDVSSRSKYTYLKNSICYVEHSIKLPKPQFYVIPTALTRIINGIRDYIPDTAMRMINAGNMKEAITYLNCGMDTHENIVQVINRSNITTLGNLNMELEYTKSLHIPDTEKQQRIKTIKDKISNITSIISHIDAKVKEMIKEDCYICAEPYDTPVIVTCCNNMYCLKCLMQSLEQAQGKCPMCRTIVTEETYTLINSNPESIITVKTPFSKMGKLRILNNLIDHIFCSPDAKVIICSDYDDTFKNIILKQKSLVVSKLSGSAAQVNSILTDFENGQINILFLNSSQYGAGLNIPFTTHIILFHKMADNTETQVIGRAQRLGRTIPLKIIYLRDSNEPIVANAISIAEESDLAKL